MVFQQCDFILVTMLLPPFGTCFLSNTVQFSAELLWGMGTKLVPILYHLRIREIRIWFRNHSGIPDLFRNSSGIVPESGSDPELVPESGSVPEFRNHR